ncbi:hypothetical protein [Streptomyces sp. MBT97]|uniref:hypothetical protein n=1 Tax=Streptomyces sp. MBT97 TaxID=2800411 RepID=UPI001F21A1C4|nr:hypothetical protein [Streptomyces sp. MBT97]
MDRPGPPSANVYRTNTPPPGEIMRIRHTAAATIAMLACTLTACTSTDSSSDTTAAKPKATASKTTEEVTQKQKDDALAAAGIPKEPTGADRQKLLGTLAAVAPDVVRYEDKAIDAARNQCSSINGGGQKLDWAASQRFSYKDVATSEAQGAKINAALKKSGFCKV